MDYNINMNQIKEQREEEGLFRDYLSNIYLFVILSLIMLSISFFLAGAFAIICIMLFIRFINQKQKYYRILEELKQSIKQTQKRLNQINQQEQQFYRDKIKMNKLILAGSSMIHLSESEPNFNQEIKQFTQQIKQEISIIIEEKESIDRFNKGINQHLLSIFDCLNKSRIIQINPSIHQQNTLNVVNKNFLTLQNSLDLPVSQKVQIEIQSRIKGISMQLKEKSEKRIKQDRPELKKYKELYEEVVSEKEVKNIEPYLKEIKEEIQTILKPFLSNNTDQQILNKEIEVFIVNEEICEKREQIMEQQSEIVDEKKSKKQTFDRKQFMKNLDFLLVKGFHERQAQFEQEEKQ